VTALTVFLLGVIVGAAITYWRGVDDLFAGLLSDYTPVVRWWHQRYGHGEGYQGYPCGGVCWSCGPVRTAGAREIALKEALLRQKNPPEPPPWPPPY